MLISLDDEWSGAYGREEGRADDNSSSIIGSEEVKHELTKEPSCKPTMIRSGERRTGEMRVWSGRWSSWTRRSNREKIDDWVERARSGVEEIRVEVQ